MEALTALDKKALEQEYIQSYKYTAGQKLMAAMAVIVFTIGILVAGIYLVLSIINALTK